MGIFEDDLKWSQDMEKYANELYKEIFKDVGFGVAKISRTRGDIRDRQYKIDCDILFKDGSQFTLQEKFQHSKYAGFKTITITMKHFKMSSQLYVMGYGELNAGFVLFYVLNYVKFKQANVKGYLQKQSEHSNADFMVYKAKDIPNDCFVYKLDKL